MSDALNTITEVATLGLVSDVTGTEAAADDISAAAGTAAAAQRESLEYLKEREAQPQFYREQALGQLGGFYGLPQYQSGVDQQQREDYTRQVADLESQIAREGTGKWNDDRGHFTRLRSQLAETQRKQSLLPEQALEGEYLPAQSGQNQMIQDVMSSPFYQSMISQGEQGIGRNLSMTGGLRSGTANEALARNSQQVLQQLTNQRLTGLQGMAALPSNANQIAQGMTGIGQTLAQGQLGGAQAVQQMNAALIGGAGSAIGGAMASDPRLKENVEWVGFVEYLGDMLNEYIWDWNEKGNKLGYYGSSRGHMADELLESQPELVTVKDGYMAVFYSKINKEIH